MQSSMATHVSEDQVVQFSLHEVQSVQVRRSHTLLGCIFMTAKLSPAEIRDWVNSPWQCKGRIKVLQAKHGLFEFVLPNEESKIWVLKRTPWLVNDKIIHLRSWTPSVTKQTYEELVMAPFRVQLWDVKDDCYTAKFGMKVAGPTIGQVLEAGVYSCLDTGRFSSR
ncbi:unnamed protein product [Linum trigynum]|uniref:DUF4283 domain-containing protein n=1 Tax=Linum trigynum TaxID=586398 RepID=A0AAV2D756_9ROSI